MHRGPAKNVPNARIDSTPIKGVPRQLAEFSKDEVLRQWRPIGAVRGHGIVRVGDSENTGFFQNRFATQSARIARAVCAFVVLVDDLRDRERRAKLLQYVVSNYTMRLNDGVLGVG
jgi:hypothetical protein